MAYLIDDSQQHPNIFLNGDMVLAQRTTSLALTGTANGYFVDRWLGYETVVNGTYSQQAVSGLAGLLFCARVQRNNGNAGIGVMSLAQNVETLEARKYQGRTVTLSFWARAGANFSSASSLLGVQFFAGTGTDESVRAGYAGAITVLNSSVTLTTTFQQFVFTILIPSTATEFAPVFSFTTVGTAGTNDYFDITGIMLNEGGLQAYRSAGGNFEAELAMCQRFYEKSYDLTTTPAAVTDTGRYMVQLPLSAANNFFSIPYKVSKRIDSGTPTYYNSVTGATGTWRDITSSGDRSVTQNSASIAWLNTAITPSSPTDTLVGHWTVDAEIT